MQKWRSKVCHTSCCQELEKKTTHTPALVSWEEFGCSCVAKSLHIKQVYDEWLILFCREGDGVAIHIKCQKEKRWDRHGVVNCTLVLTHDKTLRVWQDERPWVSAASSFTSPCTHSLLSAHTSQNSYAKFSVDEVKSWIEVSLVVRTNNSSELNLRLWKRGYKWWKFCWT